MTLAQIIAKARDVLPTDMSTQELRKLDAAVRQRSVFSARATNIDFVDAIKKSVDRLLAGETNEATMRAGLQDVLDSLDYDPARGFPGDAPDRVPPAEVGALRDLSSEKRLRLILDTQESMMANAGRMRAGNTQDERFSFPAWELVRVARVQQPRGLTGTKQDPTWEERFILAGGELVAGRMIALKDDAVWQNLGSSGTFDDGLDNPYPPYAFNSGMGWRSVGRDECIALGLITGDEIPEATEFDLNGDLPQRRDDALDGVDPSLLEAAFQSLSA